VNSSSGFQAAIGGKKMKSKKKVMKGKGQQKPDANMMVASPAAFVARKKGGGKRKR
jgi:hypothetical protein